jgi:hypothetical protein
MDLGSENRKKCYGNVTAIVCNFLRCPFSPKPPKTEITKEDFVWNEIDGITRKKLN